jgi:hypothetical protein
MISVILKPSTDGPGPTPDGSRSPATLDVHYSYHDSITILRTKELIGCLKITWKISNGFQTK